MGEIELLLVEDDEEVARVVCEELSLLEFHTSRAPDLASAERHLVEKQFHAIVLDLTLPDGDGLDLAASLRAAGDETPILMLTARDGVSDRLAGFGFGADDYMGKPFDVNELAARLRAIVRRSARGARHLLRYADLDLNLLTRTARRPQIEVTLSDRETELLACLLRHPETVLSRDYLLNEVWGDEVDGASNLVNVYVNFLRNKIESPNHQILIHTVRGVGYMFSTQEPRETG